MNGRRIGWAGVLVRAGLGIILASLAAGPILAGLVGLGNLATANATRAIDPSAAHAGVALLQMAGMFMLLGTMFSAVPTLIGTVIMGLGGVLMPICRHPLIWMLAGGAGGLIFDFWAFGLRTQAPIGYVAFALTGAACALISRALFRWPD